jgi:hypothetical protein
MKKIILSILCVILLSGIKTIAQDFPNKMQNDELRNKLHDYYKQNIFPQMNIWKSKIDKSLTTEDLQILNKLRTKANEIVKARRNTIDSLRKSNSLSPNMPPKHKGGKFGHHGNPERDKVLMDELKLQIGDELKSLLTKNEDLVKDILVDAKDNTEKWRNDHKSMVEEFMKNNGIEIPVGREHKPKDGKESKNHKILIAKIFLWDGLMENEELSGFPKRNLLKDKNINVNVYPNPFSEKATISFSLSKESNVNLYITNSNGKVVSKLYNGQAKSGNYNYDFKAENLTPGVYIYNLEIDGKIQSGNIVLNK